MKIIFIFSCSGMFRNVPECSGMFRNVPCSWFYRRPQTCRRSLLASYGSPRGWVHVHVFTHFSSVLNLHSITFLVKIVLSVHRFEPFSSLGRLGLIFNGPMASPQFQDHVPKRNNELWGREQGSSRSQSRAPCSRRQLQLNLSTTATMGTEKSGRCREMAIKCGDPTVFHSEDTFIFFIFKSVDDI